MARATPLFLVRVKYSTVLKLFSSLFLYKCHSQTKSFVRAYFCSTCGTSNRSGIISVVGANNMYSLLNSQLSQRVTQSLSQITKQINDSIASNFPNISIVTTSQLTQIQQSKNESQSANFNSTIQQVLLLSILTSLYSSVLNKFILVYALYTSICLWYMLV